MADKSKIEWTDATWNPIAGCSVVSPCNKLTFLVGKKAAGRLLDGVLHDAFPEVRP